MELGVVEEIGKEREEGKNNNMKKNFLKKREGSSMHR